MKSVDPLQPADREELCRRIHFIRSRLGTALTLFMIALGLFLIIFLSLVIVIQRYAPFSPAEPIWIGVAFPFAGVLVVMLLCSIFDAYSKRIRKTLVCPECGGDPVESLDFAMTTCCCLHCGAGLIRGDATSDERLRGNSRQFASPEVAPQNRKLPSRRVLRPIASWGIAGVVTAGMGALVGVGLAQYFQLTDMVEYRKLIVAVGALMGIPVAGFGLLKALHEEGKLRPHCPQCYKFYIRPRVVRWTGCCDVCGRETSPPEIPHKLSADPETTRIPIADILAEQKQVRSRNLGAVLWGVFAAAGCIGLLLLLFWLLAPDDISVRNLKWWGLTPLLALLIQVVVTVVAHNRATMRFKCPACRKNLNSQRFPIIIATGGCPECGRQILDRKFE